MQAPSQVKVKLTSRTPGHRFIRHTSPEIRDLHRCGAEVPCLCAENAAEVDRNGSFPAKEFAKIASDGLLVAPQCVTRSVQGTTGLGVFYE
jgi:hypothetical protein